jgi:hypothetical protein
VVAVRIVDEGDGSVVDIEGDGDELAVLRRRLAREEIGRQIEVLEDLMPTVAHVRAAHVGAATALAHLRNAHAALGAEAAGG